MTEPALRDILPQTPNAFAADGVWYLSISRDRILALTRGNKLRHPKPGEANSFRWLQGAILSVCLTFTHLSSGTLNLIGRRPFLDDRHCQSFDLLSLVKFIRSPNLWGFLCISQPSAYPLSLTYKITIYRMESSKTEAAFTIHFLLSVYLICQALKFGKIHFKTELKMQYCTLESRKNIYL